MTDREDRLVAARAANAVQQWPTLTEAFGCVDCTFLFRFGHACPLCGSASIFDVARHFNTIGFNNGIRRAEEEAEQCLGGSDAGSSSVADSGCEKTREPGSASGSGGQ